MAVGTSTGSFPFLQVRPSARPRRAVYGRRLFLSSLFAFRESDLRRVVRFSPRALSFSGRGILRFPADLALADLPLTKLSPVGLSPAGQPAQARKKHKSEAGEAVSGRAAGTAKGARAELDDGPVDVVRQRRRAARRVDPDAEPHADGRPFTGRSSDLPPDSPLSVNLNDNGKGESGVHGANSSETVDPMAPENWFPIPPTREDRYLDEMISVPLIEEPIGQVSLSRREWRRPFSEIIMRHFGTKNAIDRMCDFLGECLGQNCTRKDLAARLGVSKEELEEVEDKGVIPDRWLLDMVFMVNANPYWLITGQGTRRLRGNPDDANSYYPVGGEEIAKPGSEIRAGKNGFS